MIRRYLPFLRWWPRVNRDSLRHDLLAGLTGAIVVLPQGVAFATIAGMPPQYGLYAGMIPAIVAATNTPNRVPREANSRCSRVNNRVRHCAGRTLCEENRRSRFSTLGRGTQPLPGQKPIVLERRPAGTRCSKRLCANNVATRSIRQNSTGSRQRLRLAEPAIPSWPRLYCAPKKRPVLPPSSTIGIRVCFAQRPHQPTNALLSWLT